MTGVRRRSGPNAGSHKSGSHERNSSKSFLSRFLPSGATSHKPRHVPVKPPSSFQHKGDKDTGESSSKGSSLLSSLMSLSTFPLLAETTSALKCLLSVRIFAAFWSNISDCDEVYNYWEPTHYLIHGTGFQTWEYSPTYAIRSYAYLWMHAAPGLLIQRLIRFGLYKRLIFYGIRILLAIICAFAETYFYRGVNKSFGNSTGRLTVIILFLSTGMYISSTAFLPSTFSMYMTLLIYGSWFQSHIKTCLISIALNALYGWPFASILSVPVIIELLVNNNKKKRKYIVKWSLIFGFGLAIPLIAIDSYYYGKLVIAPLNIVLYNVFSSHGANLYGTEPWTFYAMNLGLNFNLALVAAAAALPILVICRFLSDSVKVTPHHWIVVGSLLFWITLFTVQRHKEERFMFPIYPLICLTAGITIELCSKLISGYSIKLSNYYSNVIMVLIAFYAMVSISRGTALFKSFNAPFDVYMSLESINDRIVASVSGTANLTSNSAQNKNDFNVSNSEDEVINLCIGKEWHRFPSSFFLPENPRNRWKLQFLQSEFRGQLPQQFSPLSNGTRLIREHFNDQNLEEESRYFGNVSKCHFIVDTDYLIATGRDIAYSKDMEKFKVIFSSPFLDTSASRPLLRSFYVPYLSETKFWSFVNYNLLQNVNMSLDLSNL